MPRAQPAAEGEPRCASRLPTDGRSSGASSRSWSATRSTWPLLNHLPRRQPRSKPTPPPAQYGLCWLRAPGSDSGSHRAGRGQRGGDHADRSLRLPAPPPRSTTLTRLGHSGRENARLPDAHAGHWTSGQADAHTGHRTPAPDIGHPRVDTARLDTGRSHRTLDAGRAEPGRGRGQGDQARPAPGRPGPPRRAAARWDAEPCSCGRRLRRPATMTGPPVNHLPARDYLPHYQAVARSLAASQAAPRRTALVCWIWMVRVEGNETKER